jgi:hypothetical protein
MVPTVPYHHGRGPALGSLARRSGSWHTAASAPACVAKYNFSSAKKKRRVLASPKQRCESGPFTLKIS